MQDGVRKCGSNQLQTYCNTSDVYQHHPGGGTAVTWAMVEEFARKRFTLSFGDAQVPDCRQTSRTKPDVGSTVLFGQPRRC